METQAFLSQWEGKWFSQRSHYDFAQNVADNHKSELTVEAVTPDATEVVSFCQAHDLKPEAAIALLTMVWDTSVDWGKPKQTGSALYLFFADGDHPSTGKVWRSATKLGAKGHYILGSDESLTFYFEDGPLKIEERLWFASPNLRFRTSLITQNKQFIHSAFYSEIRKLPPTKTE
ncbi:MAG: phycobiliprotein lyase [Microcystaceae cyanobacterium]